MKQYFVYIMANNAKMTYIGVTNDLKRRVYQHKEKLIPGYTAKYNLTQLIYFETTSDIKSAILREKQMKGWLRARKIDLINEHNPGWKDLSQDWFT